MTRLIVAALFVVVGMGVGVALLSQLGLDRLPPWMLAAVMTVLLLVLIVVAMALFNGGDIIGTGGGQDQLRQWEEQGLLISTEYRAVRAFQVAEFEDEGPHYFLELEDGSVLYLNGQYLYDYEAIEDDEPEFNQPRRFPCTEFTIRRHRDRDFVVDISCRGTVLQPEEQQPAFTTSEWRHLNLGDGEIIRDRTYDEVKASRYRGSRGF